MPGKRIASLPMYDLPELTGPTDRLWQRIRDGLHARALPAPEALSRDIADPRAHWLYPGLVLSQTCSLPYRSLLHDRVTLVGTPDYGLPDCPPGYYRSALVARAGDPRTALADFDGATLAYNEAGSQSGWAAPQAAAQAAGIRLLAGPATGAHRRSIAVVAKGGADLAAIDAVTWALLADREPACAALKVVGYSQPTPGLPLITARRHDPAPIFQAIAAAIAGLDAGDRAALRLTRIVQIPPETYMSLAIPPNP